jgi:hypothetical protein
LSVIIASRWPGGPYQTIFACSQLSPIDWLFIYLTCAIDPEAQSIFPYINSKYKTSGIWFPI